jgi:hypothetical protein
MKRVAKRIALLTAALMVVALPVLADEATENKQMNPAEQGGKVECLIVAMNSCDRVGTAENQIDRITTEINKGSAVYTRDELKTLNDELDRANSDLRDEYGGP